ncbi:MAG TPA: hypothetical protein VFK12_02250 [Gammaproteobacteria bacterium]|nr:hypothetical protein [Gammaproteobacteria bacterium]
MLLKWANEHGVWGAVQAIVLVASFVIGLKIIYFPRRRIRNLNFHARLVRSERNKFRLMIYLELRNYTGRTVVLSSPFFRYLDLRAPSEAHGDTPSREYEIRFPSNGGKELTEVEYLLRNKESVHTIIALDPAHTDQEVHRALNKHRIGTFIVKCIWLQDAPRVQRLSRRI